MIPFELSLNEENFDPVGGYKTTQSLSSVVRFTTSFLLLPTILFMRSSTQITFFWLCAVVGGSLVTHCIKLEDVVFTVPTDGESFLDDASKGGVFFCCCTQISNSLKATFTAP